MKPLLKIHLFVFLILIVAGTGCAKITSLGRTSKHQSSHQVSSSFSEETRKYQKYLKTLGYYEGETDGIIGPRTRRAVSEFQKDSNLNVTGKLDRQTTDELDAMLNDQ